MVTVGRVMTRGVSPLYVGQTLDDVQELLNNSPLPGLPVVNKGFKVLGILFKDDRLAKFKGDTPLVKYCAGKPLRLIGVFLL